MHPDSTTEQPPDSEVEAALAHARGQPDGETPQKATPSPFPSLFTVVTDSNGNIHHPRVHFLFEDDDADLLPKYVRHYDQPLQQSTSASSASKSMAPPNRRIMILDLVPKPATVRTNTSSDHVPADDGYQVACASSLSSDWAVVNTTLAPMTAGAHDAPPTAPLSSDQRQMLRIEGVDLSHPPHPPHPPELPRLSSHASSSSASSVSTDQKSREDCNALVANFDERMAVLRKVVDFGADTQANIADAGRLHPSPQHGTTSATSPRPAGDPAEFQLLDGEAGGDVSRGVGGYARLELGAGSAKADATGGEI